MERKQALFYFALNPIRKDSRQLEVLFLPERALNGSVIGGNKSKRRGKGLLSFLVSWRLLPITRAVFSGLLGRSKRATIKNLVIDSRQEGAGHATGKKGDGTGRRAYRRGPAETCP
jgi:hypothetical protein